MLIYIERGKQRERQKQRQRKSEIYDETTTFNKIDIFGLNRIINKFQIQYIRNELCNEISVFITGHLYQSVLEIVCFYVSYTKFMSCLYWLVVRYYFYIPMKLIGWFLFFGIFVSYHHFCSLDFYWKLPSNCARNKSIVVYNPNQIEG